MVIKLRKQSKQETPWHTITPEQLASYCVEITGGGYNVSQVNKAMLLQRDILSHTTEPWKSAAGIIEIIIQE